MVINNVCRLMLTLMLLLWGTVSYAATVYATVSKNRVVQNEVFVLKVVADENMSANSIDWTVLNKDFITSDPGFSSAISIINGQQSVRSEWMISLIPRHKGRLTIPALNVNGNLTKAITIEVSADTQAPKMADLIELQNTLDRKTLYPGESALLQTKLIIKTSINSIRQAQLQPPSATGLELQPVSDAKQYQEVVNGVETTVVEQTFRVTAQQAGNFVINGGRFSAKMLYQDGSHIAPINIQAKANSVSVLDKPAGYKGFWLPTSKLSLSQNWTDEKGNRIKTDTINNQVGDAITRQIELRVSGLSAEQLPNLVIPYPDTVRVYSDKPQFSSDNNGNVVMILKQVIIANQAGQIILPAVEVPWWNSVTRSAESSHITGLTLNVAAAKGHNLPSSPAPIDHVDVTSVTDSVSVYWVYATLVMSLLWLITLYYALYLRQSKRRTIPISQPVEGDNYHKLQVALRQQDGIAIQAALKSWKDAVILTAQEQQQLAEKLEQFQQGLYGQQQKIVDIQALADLVSTIEKQQHKRLQSSRHGLAKL